MSTPRASAAAFTMVEMLIVAAIVGILAVIGSGVYDRQQEKVRVSQAATDIGVISTAVMLYETDRNALPASLGEVGFQNKSDPWGRPYQYFDLESMRGNGVARKDRRLAPLNSDFDLYSLGKDGHSRSSLAAKESRDDVVRARDGRFIGLASDFDP